MFTFRIIIYDCVFFKGWGEFVEIDPNAEATGDVAVPVHIAQAIENDVSLVQNLEDVDMVRVLSVIQ